MKIEEQKRKIKRMKDKKIIKKDMRKRKEIGTIIE